MRKILIFLSCLTLIIVYTGVASGDTPLPVGGGWQSFNWGSGASAPAYENAKTFTLLVPGELDVTDAYQTGDQFAVYNKFTLLGNTLFVPVTGDWAGDPDVTFSDPRWSHGSWLLAAGDFSINIYTITNPFDYGTGYLRVFETSAAVPEPATMLLLGSGLLGLAGYGRKKFFKK